MTPRSRADRHVEPHPLEDVADRSRIVVGIGQPRDALVIGHANTSATRLSACAVVAVASSHKTDSAASRQARRCRRDIGAPRINLTMVQASIPERGPWAGSGKISRVSSRKSTRLWPISLPGAAVGVRPNLRRHGCGREARRDPGTYCSAVLQEQCRYRAHLGAATAEPAYAAGQAGRDEAVASRRERQRDAAPPRPCAPMIMGVAASAPRLNLALRRGGHAVQDDDHDRTG